MQGIEKAKEWQISPEHVHISGAEARCIDPRFAEQTDGFLAEVRGEGSPDSFIKAGGAMELAGEHPEDMLHQFTISYDKHGVRDFTLTVHEDCAAYGDRMPKEHGAAIEFMAAELRKAREVVLAHFEGRELPTVRLYAIGFDGPYKID
jgi:hypothetical protein